MGRSGLKWKSRSAVEDGSVLRGQNKTTTPLGADRSSLTAYRCKKTGQISLARVELHGFPMTSREAVWSFAAVSGQHAAVSAQQAVVLSCPGAMV